MTIQIAKLLDFYALWNIHFDPRQEMAIFFLSVNPPQRGTQ